MGKTTEPSTYCRKCFYDVRGIGTPSRCPECGEPFDLSDPKTFRTRRPRGIWRRLHWVVYPLLLIVLACAAGFGWLWWGWHREQPGLIWVSQHGGYVDLKSVGPPRLQRMMGRWCYLLDRGCDADRIVISENDSPGQSLLWRLDGLESIAVHGPGFTDDWALLLGQRLRPNRVTLWNTSLTTRGLANLQLLGELEILNLGPVPIDDEALAQFGRWRELKWLSLSGTDIRGPGLAHLVALPKLEELHLGGAPLDDSAVDHLTKMTKLKTLGLIGTKITPQGLERLRKSLPNCTVLGPLSSD